jgi:hypothetical protein
MEQPVSQRLPDGFDSPEAEAAYWDQLDIDGLASDELEVVEPDAVGLASTSVPRVSFSIRLAPDVGRAAARRGASRLQGT